MSKLLSRAVVAVTALTTFACHWAVAATAAPAATASEPIAASNDSMVGELLGIVLPLALIIVALFVLLHVLRRRFGLTGQDAPLTVLQILPVGPRERIVLIKARSGRVFTVGVASQSVTLITNLDPSDLVAPETTPAETTTDTGITARR